LEGSITNVKDFIERIGGKIIGTVNYGASGYASGDASGDASLL
jgi:hypothetical protein